MPIVTLVERNMYLKSCALNKHQVSWVFEKLYGLSNGLSVKIAVLKNDHIKNSQSLIFMTCSRTLKPDDRRLSPRADILKGSWDSKGS